MPHNFHGARSRAKCIAGIKACLDRLAANDYSEDQSELAWYVARADDDVAAGAVAAFGRQGGVESNLLRQVGWERQMAVARRYGELADGTIGYEKVCVHPDFA